MTKFIYFDTSSGLSGDMILGALIDLGVSPAFFKENMAQLGLPVEIQIKEVKRASIRGLKVDVRVKTQKKITRKWADIKTLIQKSPFSPHVKNTALSIFKKLFQAEAHVHGHKFHEAHLHEAGADDAIVDIVGCCFLAAFLDIGEFYASSLNVGQGWIKTSHGILPVPPPAVAELLKGIPVYSAWVKEELVTPTGAAIVSTLVKKFIPFPEICYQKVGCGAGQKNFSNFPNILRAFYGESHEFRPDKKFYIVETCIDDSTPEILAGFYDKAFGLGASDVFFTPILMKKNRMATKLTVLAEADKIEGLIDAVFQETSSIGLRYFPVERRVLERTTEKVKVLGEDVSIKIALLKGKQVSRQPEYSDCLKLAKKKKVPVRKIFELALEEFSNKTR
ncbi:nickel pincer cofactor biosynthesis protein LarC [Acidobacteriota bacterium]